MKNNQTFRILVFLILSVSFDPFLQSLAFGAEGYQILKIHGVKLAPGGKMSVSISAPKDEHLGRGKELVIPRNTMILKGETPVFIVSKDYEKASLSREKSIHSLSGLMLNKDDQEKGEYTWGGFATGPLLKIMQSINGQDFATQQAAIWVGIYDQPYESLRSWVISSYFLFREEPDYNIRMIDNYSILKALDILYRAGFPITEKKIWNTLECQLIGLASKEPQLRLSAVSGFKTYGYDCDQSIGCVTEALKSSEKFIRLTAMETIGILGDPAGIRVLENYIDNALEEENETLRVVVTALERLNWKPKTVSQRCTVLLIKQQCAEFRRMGVKSKEFLELFANRAKEGFLRGLAEKCLKNLK